MPVCNGIEATRVIKEELPPRLATQLLSSFAQDSQEEASDLAPVGGPDDATAMNRSAGGTLQTDCSI